MRETLLLDVPHRQIVFTIPKRLRVFFKYKRRLLGDLCRCALRSLSCYFEIVTGSALTPGVIAAIQTFGDRINLHPHLHYLVTEGGAFHKIPRIDDSRLAEIFAREVLAFLVGRELLSPEWAERLLSWPHSGFNVHGGRGPGPCPGDPFPPHSPGDKDAGEWRAEGSPLAAWSGPRRSRRPSGWGSTCSGRFWPWNG
jgi:hypothetical protein